METSSNIDQQANRIGFYFFWSAKIAGVYFAARVLGGILLNTVFALIFNPFLFQLLNLLIPVFVGFFLYGLILLLRKQNLLVPNDLSRAIGVLGTACLLVLSIVFALLSLFPDMSEVFEPTWLASVMVFFWLLGIFSVFGLSALLYTLYTKRLIRGETCVYVLAGACTIVINLTTLSSSWGYYSLLIGLLNLIGLGWYFGVLQLAALATTGKDQPISSY